MSTFCIYPLDQKDHQFQHHHHPSQPPNKEPGLSQLKSLSATGLSRILEIPLCLLENANSKDQQQQQQVYWLTNAHLNNTNDSGITSSHVAPKDEASTITATNELVTHSFANRKRSIVKRRKSVLSASFTAEDEAEAIRIDREHTLAALERGHRSEGERKEEKETQEIAEQEEGILEHDPSSNRESIFDAPRNIYSQQNLTFDVVNDGNVYDFELLKKPQELNRGNMRKEQKKEEEEEENDIPSKQVSLQQQKQQQQTEGANVVNPKDSAIDLRATALEQEKDDKEQAGIDIADDDSCTKVIDLSLASSLSLSSATGSSAPPLSSSSVSSHSPAPAMTTTLKKKSSWSPRRMFSAPSKKSTIDDRQEKFNISSLFSRKSSSPSSKKSNQNNNINNNSKSLDCTSKAKNDSCTLSKNTVSFNYTRLPIHTERAIYRLSHLKLTTPRRPLRDQVIISNLMFWYLSIVSTNCTTTENEPAPMEHLVMTKKACRMQQQQIHHKKRRMRNQVRPENSNAMDIITKQQKKPHQHRPHVNKKTAIRLYSNNSSSEEEDDEDGDDTDTDSDDNSDSFSFTSSNSSLSMSDVDYMEQKKMAKKTSKYSIFSSKKRDKRWLPSFSKGTNRVQQQRLQPDDDDDIPLAMYQTK
ncbi:hypothetical protein MAM1_0309c09513 [Mucor ambiguus]|uniref:Protein Zds1 C-terminal domain-containing protein n=1 Tax=Mucor ambiguus TaxID=91626 RepID=A0A0C9LXD9_9FUNG|nr:hypothetical protein MAM1_0309c09513 [Mucor ambiguus]